MTWNKIQVHILLIFLKKTGIIFFLKHETWISFREHWYMWKNWTVLYMTFIFKCFQSRIKFPKSINCNSNKSVLTYFSPHFASFFSVKSFAINSKIRGLMGVLPFSPGNPRNLLPYFRWHKGLLTTEDEEKRSYLLLYIQLELLLYIQLELLLYIQLELLLYIQLELLLYIQLELLLYIQLELLLYIQLELLLYI